MRSLVPSNKTYASDARAILADRATTGQFAILKSMEQQATLTWHRQRQSIIKMHTMQINALHGLRNESSATFAKSHQTLFGEAEQTLDRLSSQMPQMVLNSLREQMLRIKALDEDIKAVEKRPGLHLKENPDIQRIPQIPGVALLTTPAAIATLGQASAFKSRRKSCA